jgi:hypothetical protein
MISCETPPSPIACECLAHSGPPAGIAACLLALSLKWGHDSGRLFMLLAELEDNSIYILREAFNQLERQIGPWRRGKDSTVRLWLARKVFFGHVPFARVRMDISYKTKERCLSRPDGYM